MLRRPDRPNRLPLQSFCKACCYLALCCAFALPAWTQNANRGEESLAQVEQFSRSIEDLSARVSPSVVRILVSQAVLDESDASRRAQLQSGNGESLGSGVIVDSDGYIITNAHVVEGAARIRVNLMPRGNQTISSVVRESFSAPIDATLVGTFREGDLALIKIAQTGLPALPLADYRNLKQGQIVFAFGSPSGLQNSVSMGLVSSIARQPDPDSPFIYIQTDTPINPGNSGGPLVNLKGEVIGINTFILSRSGGNEGVGFAIPSTLLHWVVPQLKKYGHVHRSTIGVGLQQITPVMAAALHLGKSSCVIISDVRQGSPAEKAGIKTDDILLSMNSHVADTLPAILGSSLQDAAGEHIKLVIQRGTEEVNFDIVSVEEPHQNDRLTELADPTKNALPELGILGITVDKQIGPLLDSLRLPTGVIVAARLGTSPALAKDSLQTGDVIHALNGKLVYTLDDLKTALIGLESSSPVALLVERSGNLSYVSFELP